MGCGKSHPAGRAGKGSESPPAFPAGVGLPELPGIPLCSLVALRSTEQPAGTAKNTPLPIPQHVGVSWPLQEPIFRRTGQAWGS